MEAEDFFEDVLPVGDSEQNVICTSNSGAKPNQREEAEVVIEKASAQQDAEVNLEEPNAQAEEIASTSATESIDIHINLSESDVQCLNPIDKPIKSESPSSTVCTSSRPDFTKLNGKICLDSLSVRELQETFRATFGRETSVKDKQWLKRRIAMGLSNSCHVLSMTFITEDGKTVEIVQEENSRTDDDMLVKNLAVGEVTENYGDLPIDCGNQSEDSKSILGKRVRNLSAGHDCSSAEDHQTSLVASKRVRKPTKRYIELSEVEVGESNVNLISSSKNLRHGHSVLKPCPSTARNARSVRRPLVTRRDALGGSGVQVPYVCRIRRSRPRENYVAFMKIRPGCMNMTAEVVKEALDSCSPQLDDELDNKVFTAESDALYTPNPLVGEPEKEKHCQEREAFELDNGKHCQERETCELEKEVEPRQWDPSGDNSDNCTSNVDTAKGGTKRKHHRPWSLTEVVNLVEGVAKYGAGKWSEIKRLAFASQSYRTSVDLKDKWRNLLRASFAEPGTDKGVHKSLSYNSRKQVSAPIPSEVLLRVRELAKMQAQVPPILSSSKFNIGNVHETSPGYL